MSALADCIKASNSFISNPTPENALAFGIANEKVQMTTDELDQVGGGCPYIDGGI